MRRNSPIAISIFLLLLMAGQWPDATGAQSADSADPARATPTSWWLALRSNGYWYQVKESANGIDESRFDFYQT